ncbi:dipeptidyl aminopeptidase/acylaminoacyl peptidase [Flavobacterium sp. 102]|nr:dipeptidyl aminopeptidase/acylaminoacyl peptidase [Flavobacterium sp. 102]
MPTSKTYRSCLLLFFLSLYACPVKGQVILKKRLTEADYGKWGTLDIQRISTEGNWTSYGMSYENKNDTLFVQHTQSARRYTIPNGRDGRFGGEKLFACLSKDSLVLHSLVDGDVQKIESVKQYELIGDGKYIVIWYINGVLEIRYAKGVAVERIADVAIYDINEQGDSLVYGIKDKESGKAGVIQFDRYRHFSLGAIEKPLNRIVWQKQGKAVVLFDGLSLYCYRFSDKKMLRFSSGLPKEQDIRIITGSNGPMAISDDGSLVFFTIAAPDAPTVKKENSAVEIWNGNDAPLFPAKESLAIVASKKTAVWFPDTGKYCLLTDELLYKIRLSGLQDYAILSNPYAYSLEPRYYEDVDYYIKNVRTGAEKLLLAKQSHDPNQLCFSPISNAFVYYRDTNWMLYNPDTDSLLNLTKLLPTTWDNGSEENVAGQFGAYGVGGWAADGTSVLLYDRHDIWKVSLNGKEGKRLTKGREANSVYRVSRVESERFGIRDYEGETRVLLDMDKGVVFSMTNQEDWSTGLCIYSNRLGLRTITDNSGYLSAVKKSDTDCFVYSSQSFSQPPQLHFISLKEGKSRTLYQSNRQQSDYHYGKSELITYTNRDCKSLKGALFYPADYDATKKYPMIVHIYEQRSKMVNRYVKPTQFNYEGFNVTHLTLNGYFVLMPDIHYKVGNPGISASDCVIAAVEAVIATGKIDPKKIGLIGHSFGGYEVDFIVTQTDLFTAAVSGAGVSDVTRRYFDLSKNSIHMHEMWRYETQQIRMGGSFYEIKNDYLNNSPLLHTDTIKTPLLLWSGKNDIIIPFEQSVAFYLALRRLKMPTILLGYPNEDHTLSKKDNQKDLTQRILKWFDYYLKDQKDIAWIRVGTSYD